MKKKEGSKSPTRKMLIKKMIKYEENLKELHKYDNKKSRVASPEARSTHNGSRSPQLNTVESKYIDEVYVDEDHRKIKLGKLKELMNSELSKAESDGALNLKKEDIDKAYAGYPQFMHRHDSNRHSFDKSVTTQKEHHIKRPLIDELKEALEDAENLYSEEDPMLTESVQKQVADHVHSKSEITITEKRLYHLEIKRHHDYCESPLRDRYDFHQRKSKEIRRLQYDATFVAKKFVPDTQNKKSLQEIPRTDTKRAPPRIAPLLLKMESHQHADYRIDSPSKMEVEREQPKKLKDGRARMNTLQQVPIRSIPDNLVLGNPKPTPLDESLMVELKPSEEDRNDPKEPTEANASVRESHPSLQMDLYAPSEDHPDSLSHHSGDHNDGSELSDQPDLDANPGDEPDPEEDPLARHSDGHSEPSEREDIDANNPDEEDPHRESQQEPSDHQSEPSFNESLVGNEGEKPEDPMHDKPGEVDDESEPSDQPDLDANPPDDPDRSREESHKPSQHETEPSEQIDLDANLPDDPDRSRRESHQPSQHESEPSEQIDLDANPPDDPDRSRDDSQKPSDHQSEPSVQSDIEANQGDNPDEQDDGQGSGIDNGESEPSDQPDLDANPPDDPDRSREESHKPSQHETEPSEQIDLDANLPDDPDRSRRESHQPSQHESEPSEQIDLDANPPDDPDRSRDDSQKPSDHQSEPSVQSDIEANQGDNPDEQDAENHPHDPHGESEPSEVVSIHSNLPDSNDGGPSEQNPHDDHGSDVEEDPELKENSVDRNDEAHRVPLGNDSEAPESEEEEVFDVVRPTEPLTISKKWERAYRERPPKPVITKRASIPVLPNTRQTLERAYIHRIYQPAKLKPAPQPFSRVVEKTYIVKPRLPVRCETSPERYSRLDEKAYFERIFDRKVIHPIAGTVKQTVETARHHPAKPKRVVEPSPEPYRKIVEVARQERIFDRKVIHPIAGTVKQTVETAKHHPAKPKRVVEPSPEPYRKIVEVARRERIFDKARVESSPEPFLKKEEVAKYKKAFERKVCQPSEAIYSQIIENHYFEKIWTPHRVRPQVSPYQSILEQTYYVRAYDPLPLEPLTQRLETKIEEYYFMKIFTRPRIQPSPARYEQYLERAYYQRINRKARGVAPALSIEAKLETCYIARIHQRKRIIPQTMSCLLERCYVHRTVVWDNAEEAASVNSASRAGESHAETSEYASARLGPDSERGSQIGHDDQNENDDQPEEDQAVEVQPANVEEFSSQLEQSETLSAGSQGSMGKSRRRFGRTNPDEKFPCWILNEDHEPEQALISSPEGFWIDLDNGKLEVMAGDPVHVEPLIAEKFDEVDSVARKRDDAKDPDCDFIIKDENKKRRQVIINPDKLPIKKSNCQLYDPEDQKVCRAKIRLCGQDPETGEPIKYFNGVLVDENHKVSHVLVKQIDEERLLMKRTKDSTTEEIITKEKKTMVGDVPAKVITLDPFYTQKSRAEQVYIPAEPFRVYKTPLLDAEEAKATSVEDDRIFEGPILVEPVHEGRTHEVFMLIPPEKRDESQIRESYIPRYVRVEPDFEIKEEQKKFDDFKNTVHQEAETQKKIEETGPSKPANNRPVSPKALKPLAVDRVDLKVADLVPTRDSLKPARRQEAHEDLDDSALGCFDSLKNSEELYYEIDYDEKKASKPELTESRGSRTNLRTNDPDQVSNGKANSQHNRSSLDQSESNISSRRPSSQASYKVVPAQKPKKTSTTSPKIVEGPARIRFDTVSDDNKKMKFVGIGKLSNPDTERSPKKYSEQLKDVKNRAASTIQLFCLYCLKKPRWRQVFLKKYKRAKTELGSEALFRRFLLHYVCLPTQVSVEKALENYLKVLSKSHK